MDIQQVAKRARVSTATVSRVLTGSAKVRETTSARVRKAVAELNYVPNTSARSLRVGHSRLLGLIVSDINNPFFPELIDAFEGLAADQGIEVIFTHTNYDLNRLRSSVRRMVERNVDGIAVMTSEMREDALTQIPRSIPVVLMNQRSLQDRYANVPVEYGNSFHQALEYLLSLYHRDIGFIAGPPELSSAKRRRRDWELAMKHLKLRVRPEWIVTGDMRVESGEAAMRTLLTLRRRPTAVLANNDLMAVGALQAAHHTGIRVPKELSLIGFDDLPLACMMVPQLTSICIPRREIAAHAFACLLRAIRGEKPMPCASVYPKLVIRQSTGAAPKLS